MSRARDRRKRLAIATWFTKHRATAIQRDVCFTLCFRDDVSESVRKFNVMVKRLREDFIHMFTQMPTEHT